MIPVAILKFLISAYCLLAEIIKKIVNVYVYLLVPCYQGSKQNYFDVQEKNSPAEWLFTLCPLGTGNAY